MSAQQKWSKVKWKYVLDYVCVWHSKWKQIPSPSCTHFTERFFLFTYIVCPFDSLLLASLSDDEMRRASSTWSSTVGCSPGVKNADDAYNFPAFHDCDWMVLFFFFFWFWHIQFIGLTRKSIFDCTTKWCFCWNKHIFFDGGEEGAFCYVDWWRDRATPTKKFV